MLRRNGIGPGDRVALLIPNTPDFPAAYYGVLALGATVVPLNTLSRTAEIEFVLRDSGAKALICASEQGVAADVAVVTVADLRQGAEPVVGYHPSSPDDIAAILYTSGTTGKPKGTMLTHRNIVTNIEVTAASPFAVRTDDRLLCCLPLSHTFGQTCGMGVFFHIGATVVLADRFHAATALELMAKHGCTVFMGVPTMYHSLLAELESAAPAPRLRRVFSGGSALAVPVLEQVRRAFGCEVYEGYGLTETSPCVAYNQPGRPTRPGTVGFPIEGVEVAITRADLEGAVELLPPGELGEVVVRGHNVMAGYLGQPEATAEVLVDGWFRTGDLGVLDPSDGYLSLVDRKKDVIIRGGYNVYPREVEEVLQRHPAVAQVAVIGLPDARLGEEICAVVVPAGDDALAEELLTYGRDELASYKCPRRIEFTDELPLGPSGKVLKRELRRKVMSAQDHYVRQVLAGLESAPDRIALWREDEQLTAGQCRAAVLTAADALRRHLAGQPAPVVAVLTVTNSPATIILRYAANLAGAALVHLQSTNAVDPTDQMAAAARQKILSRTGATFLAVDKENLDAARELCDRLPEPPRLAALGALGPDVLDLSSGDPDAFDPDAVEIDPEQPAVVICTSGTGGSPKAVTMPYRVRSLLLQMGLKVGFQPLEPLVYLSTLPVCNSSSAVVDLALASGGTVVLHDGFDAGDVLRAVKQHRVCTLTITPPQLYMLIDHPDIVTTDRSSIRTIAYIGSPAAPARLAEALEVFGPVLLQIYGTTETGTISVLTPPDHLDPELRTTSGRPAAELRIRDLDDDRDVPPGEIGEVCVRSPSAMLGYWGEPELTAVTVRDGWVHTGDLGSIEGNGFLRLHGRMGEVMKTNGIKVHPTDVENALMTHPEVAQAAVYCVVDGDRVEHIHAAVVVRPGRTVDSGTLIGHVAAELSPKHVPVGVTFHDALPLTGAGKPDKQTLAARHTR